MLGAMLAGHRETGKRGIPLMGEFLSCWRNGKRNTRIYRRCGRCLGFKEKLFCRLFFFFLYYS